MLVEQLKFVVLGLFLCGWVVGCEDERERGRDSDTSETGADERTESDNETGSSDESETESSLDWTDAGVPESSDNETAGAVVIENLSARRTAGAYSIRYDFSALLNNNTDANIAEIDRIDVHLGGGLIATALGCSASGWRPWAGSSRKIELSVTVSENYSGVKASVALADCTYYSDQDIQLSRDPGMVSTVGLTLGGLHSDATFFTAEATGPVR